MKETLVKSSTLESLPKKQIKLRLKQYISKITHINKMKKINNIKFENKRKAKRFQLLLHPLLTSLFSMLELSFAGFSCFGK